MSSTKLSENNSDLENICNDFESEKSYFSIDTLSNVTGSIIGGSPFDYLAGLTFIESSIARGQGITVNFLFGGAYGKYRDFISEKLKVKKTRKYFREFIAYNTFQIPLYASQIMLATFVRNGEIDFDKVINGSRVVALASIVAAPLLGFYMDKCRKCLNSSE